MPSNDCGPRTIWVDAKYKDGTSGSGGVLTDPFTAQADGNSGFGFHGTLLPEEFSVTFSGDEARAAILDFYGLNIRQRPRRRARPKRVRVGVPESGGELVGGAGNRSRDSSGVRSGGLRRIFRRGINGRISAEANPATLPTFVGANFGLSAGLFGGSVGIKCDKFGNIYLSGGPTFGISPPVTASITTRGKTYKNGAEVTLERDVRDVIGGPSSSVTFTGLPAEIPAGGTASWNTPWPMMAFGPPIPTGGSMLSRQVGVPELTYSPQPAIRLPFVHFRRCI